MSLRASSFIMISVGGRGFVGCPVVVFVLIFLNAVVSSVVNAIVTIPHIESGVLKRKAGRAALRMRFFALVRPHPEIASAIQLMCARHHAVVVATLLEVLEFEVKIGLKIFRSELLHSFLGVFTLVGAGILIDRPAPFLALSILGILGFVVSRLPLFLVARSSCPLPVLDVPVVAPMPALLFIFVDVCATLMGN